ncbi:MAG: hypothetical protein DMC62_04100 [Verrucomicrobia bacterium]|nr:MAG: hypothetical protein DMC62_04100 [Verrucomicrobiota bacterium]
MELFDVKETSAILARAISGLQHRSVELLRPCGKIAPHHDDAKIRAIDSESFRELTSIAFIHAAMSRARRFR